MCIMVLVQRVPPGITEYYGTGGDSGVATKHTSGIPSRGCLERPRSLVLAHVVLSGNVVLAEQRPATPRAVKKNSVSENDML
jgi:hypothetical protein